MRGGSRTRDFALGGWVPRLLVVGLLALTIGVRAHVYNETLDPWNLNKNQDATDCIDFTTPKRANYTKSPENWRSLPTYTLLADKWIDGDPSNNDFFDLIYEYDWRETQLRSGGDIAGLLDPRGLDYIESMGYRSIYIAGTPFLNMPWQADSYSAIDFGLLDPHFGTLEEWAAWVDEVHRRGMYVIFDFTVGTMGDLIGFKGHLNSSTPFNTNEYEVQWKLPDYAPWGLNKYPDFNFTNEYNESCRYPTFWDESGVILDMGMQGCYASTFDHYGDIEAFGVFPDWMRQLAKFASVQDRLREWRPDVMDRLTVFSCMCIEALDIDGIRIDKAIQVTVDALAKWSGTTRECARKLGKENFFIPGEITGGDTFGSIYIGRGRTPQMRTSVDEALNLTHDDMSKFIRDRYQAPVDAAAFHYSLYRSMLRWLGMDGMLSAGYDVPVNFVDSWNTMLINNDFLNQMTGEFDPRHMWGVTNQDVLRWPIMSQGVERQLVGSFVTHLLMPGMPKAWYGEEQELYILDSSASNYLYGRQSMVATGAWKRHGCYRLGADQYFNLPYDRVLMGCLDDKVALDHFDPTAPIRRTIRNMNYVRSQFPGIQDGFMLSHLSNHTHLVQYPGSGDIPTETGLWSSHRGPSPKQMSSGGIWNRDGDLSQGVWLMYTNLNVSKTYEVDCQNDPILGPFPPNTRVRNLLYPFDEHELESSNSPLDNRGCVAKIDIEPYDFKAYVPVERWIPMLPSISGFTPGHDARVVKNGDTVDIEIEWDQEMDCDSVNQALTDADALKFVGEPGASPRLVASGQFSGCQTIENRGTHDFVSATVSRWKWTGQIQGAAEGMYHLQIKPVAAQGGNRTTQVADHLLFRVGAEDNTFVFPDHDYDNSILSVSGNSYTLTHKAWGADSFRYSADFGKHWTDWTDMEEVTTLNATAFEDHWWKGDHLMVHYYSRLAGTAAQVVHADANYDGHERRYPQMMLRGKFNGWGYDLGMDAHLSQKDHGDWHIPVASAWPSQFQLNIWAFDDYFYGDADGDGVIDRLPPNALTPNFLNVSAPPRPHLSWEIHVNDQTGRWSLKPLGHESSSIITFALLLIIPIITALAAAAIFRYSFYQIKINKWGQKPVKESSYFPIVGAAVHHDKKDGTVSEKNGAGAVVHHHHEKLKPLDHPIGWPEIPAKRRKVLIATLEYEIFDWQLKVKIGGLGVMSGLMGKAMTDVDLIWIIPKVQDLDYPMGEYAEPIEVTIFGEPYLIEVETHELDNITYVILDSPVFRAQTKSDPYPQRMDDLSSAIFYSTWNQAIAETIRRFQDIDIYHINDYHGALAPLYLLPQIMPVCLSLHNAEFQGLWPLRTKEEMKEVCAAFNISKDICSKYVQFGNTFNLLHAAASFISHHQKSVGVAGVSDKYGKRSWARYPALWTLRNIDSLPNPDPTDIAALDEKAVDVDKIQIDADAEAKRPEFKRQAQEWAGIKQDPNADLFVFVGRWSKQKGVDLIADVMPSLLEKKPKIQLICVGPVIDLYGRFAAEKLSRLMEMYPDRVYSKPEFTALPPYLFSGADFALIPSRDEPFGLVAVEFGRKGALGVGSRLGGLGLMPGWWFPVESPAAQHMLSQLTKTIKLALKSTQEERAILRARSAVQRFPVVEWRQRLEDFQRRSIQTSRSMAGNHAWGFDGVSPDAPSFSSPRGDPTASLAALTARSGTPDSTMSQSDYPGTPPASNLPPGAAGPNGGLLAAHDYHRRFDSPKSRGSGESYFDEGGDDRLSVASRPKFISGIEDDQSIMSSDPGDTTTIATGAFADGAVSSGHAYDNFLAAANRQFAKNQGNRSVPDPFMERRQSSMSMASDSNFAPSRPFSINSRVSSFDSISSIVDEKGASSSINKAMESFTDSDGEVSQAFVQKLQNLSSANSKGDLCIEKFLIKSEKQFFSEMKREKLTAASVRSRDSFRESMFHSSHSGAPPAVDGFRPESPVYNSMSGHSGEAYSWDNPNGFGNEEEHEKPMTRLQIIMDHSICGWPLYAIVLSLGQLLSATSFQLSLLGGSSTQTAVDMYIICAIFVVATVFWYTFFRMRPSVYVLSLPWVLFAIAFFLVGFPSLHGPFIPPQQWLTKVATWFYAMASAAGFLFFGLNFGEEAGAATEIWIMRACVVQGLQQIWVSALWYWGYTLSGTDPDKYIPSVAIICVVWPLAAVSLLFAVLMYWGLPEYYHQIPPYVPNFFKTLVRRKLVIWFLISEVLRNYWLSPVYGRNWQFLWQAADVPKWSIVIMIIIFFIGIWGLLLGILIKYSKVHAWLLPVFAVGLGCPRWCQMFWGVSGLGLYVSWGGPAGPYIGTCTWLWLGVLDAIQGVGLGMILLQTLSRLHVCATLAAAQFIGSIVVMIARATAPNKIGPGPVFPNPALYNPETGENNPVAHYEFWICLVCQMIIPFGYFFFFRKEQLTKP